MKGNIFSQQRLNSKILIAIFLTLTCPKITLQLAKLFLTL